MRACVCMCACKLIVIIIVIIRLISWYIFPGFVFPLQVLCDSQAIRTYIWSYYFYINWRKRDDNIVRIGREKLQSFIHSLLPFVLQSREICMMYTGCPHVKSFRRKAGKHGGRITGGLSRRAAISLAIDKIDGVCQQNDGHRCIIDATIWPTAAYSAPSPPSPLLRLLVRPSFIDSVGLVGSMHEEHEDSANAPRSAAISYRIFNERNLYSYIHPN